MSYKPAGHTSVSPYLIVPDAEAAFARALEAGGREVRPRADQEDGDRRGGGGGGDPTGTTWCLSTALRPRAT